MVLTVKPIENLHSVKIISISFMIMFMSCLSMSGMVLGRRKCLFVRKKQGKSELERNRESGRGRGEREKGIILKTKRHITASDPGDAWETLSWRN